MSITYQNYWQSPTDTIGQVMTLTRTIQLVLYTVERNLDQIYSFFAKTSIRSWRFAIAGSNLAQKKSCDRAFVSGT